ncbi:MAG: coiled-coil protein [Candidatus Heimdallarchaeota archaeon]
MTEEQQQKDSSQTNKQDSVEEFEDNPEVIDLRKKLTGLSKDQIKKDMDILRSSTSQLSSQIDQLKKKRGEANAEARHYRSMRDNVSEEKFIEIEKLRTEADKHKEIRDNCNEEIRNNKKRREEIKGEIRAAWDKVKELREKYYKMKDEVGVMPEEITNEIRDLEWEQQTSSISPDEDAEMTKRITELYEKAYAAHLIGYSAEDLDTAVEKAKKLSAEHDEAHQNVLDNHEKGQEHHEKMSAIYEKLNKMRSGGNTLHDKYLAARQAADLAHEKIVENYEKIKLKQYLMDMLDDEQIRRRHEKSLKMKEERIAQTKEKSSSSKRLSLDELRLLIGDDEDEEEDDED